ncbi:MAG: hypothetical protein IMZ71_01800 [Chloroflexi bacterium]|nr:hypothetical protein [Chloroflexota bacterium]MBE3131923.1 hypothetical protein [Acidobacteriota bacterium]
MILREWLRPPRHLLALFIAVIVLPAIALAWLAWRTFEQDKALERQRLQERLEAAASSIVSELDRRLDELSRQLPALVASSEVSLPDDFLLLTIRDGTITDAPPGRVLYYPRLFRVFRGWMTKDEALWKVWEAALVAVFQGAVGVFCASTAPSPSTGRP